MIGPGDRHRTIGGDVLPAVGERRRDIGGARGVAQKVPAWNRSERPPPQLATEKFVRRRQAQSPRWCSGEQDSRTDRRADEYCSSCRSIRPPRCHRWTARRQNPRPTRSSALPTVVAGGALVNIANASPPRQAARLIRITGSAPRHRI